MDYKIKNDVIRNLSSSPFKKDDADLVPAAGTCQACPKRSGANTLLFPDVKAGDRCFDSVCFNLKVEATVAKGADDILHNHPEILLVENQHGTDRKAIKKAAADLKIAVLTQYKHFETVDKKARGAVKAFWINGRDEGKFTFVKLYKSESQKASKASEAGEISAAEQIKGINERQVRARELDAEKVFARIVDAVEKHPAIDKLKPLPVTKFDNRIPEWSALLFMAFEKMGYYDGAGFKALGINDSTPAKLWESLQAMTPTQIAMMVRLAVFNEYKGWDPKSNDAFVRRKIAHGLPGVHIHQFEADQAAIAKKRTESAKKRIEDIKRQAQAKKKIAGDKKKPVTIKDLIKPKKKAK